MFENIYVELPRSVAESLIDDGFLRAGAARGLSEILAATQVVISFLGGAVDATTIVVARHDIARFVRHLWRHAWHQQGNVGDHVDIQARVRLSPGELETVIRWHGVGGESAGHADPPEVVIHIFTLLLESAMQHKPTDG